MTLGFGSLISNRTTACRLSHRSITVTPNSPKGYKHNLRRLYCDAKVVPTLASSRLKVPARSGNRNPRLPYCPDLGFYSNGLGF